MSIQQTDTWIGKLHRHRGAVIGVAATLFVFALGMWPFTRFDPSMARLFPKESAAGRNLSFLSQVRFANKIIFSFSSSAVLTPADHAAIDAFEQRLLALPSIKGISSQAAKDFSPAEIAETAKSMPFLLPANRLAEIAPMLTPAELRKTLRQDYLRLLKPEGSFLAPLLAVDPLGLMTPYFERMKKLSSIFGYSVQADSQGRLLSADGLHRLLVAETSAQPSDRAASAALVRGLDDLRQTLPTNLSVQIACGHLHTVSNEQITKRDLTQATYFSALTFLIIFILFFRDFRVLLVPLMPLFALLFAFPFTGLFTGALSFLVPAFGPILVGLTVDYGLHIYLAIRNGHPVYPLFQPIFSGLATTLCVFAAFAVSAIPAYRQLALFSCTALLLSFCGALFLLPLFIKGKAPNPATSPAPPPYREEKTWPNALCFIFFLAALSFFSCRVPVSLNLSDLDGAAPKIKADEASIRAVWQPGGENRGTFLATMGTNVSSALARTEALLPSLAAFSNTVSYLTYFPVPGTEPARLRAWQDFWRPRLPALQRDLPAAAAPYGFTVDAFEPFLQLAATTHPASQTPRLLEQVKPLFLSETAAGKAVSLVYLPEAQPAALADLSRSIGKDPDSFLISMPLLRDNIRALFSHEVNKIQLAALFFLLAASACFLRSVKRFFRVFLPPLAGVLGIFLCAMACHLSLNLIHLVTALLVLGICYDYGAFMDAAIANGTVRGARKAITLCWITTVAGTFPLLFGAHPVITAIGFALTAGTSFGWLCSLLLPVVSRGAPSVLLLLLLFPLSGCRMTCPEPAFSPLAKGAIVRPYGTASATFAHTRFSSSVKFSIRGHAFLSLCETEVDNTRHTFVSVGITPTGLTLFRVSGDASGAHCDYLAQPLAAIHPRLGEWISADLAALFLAPVSTEMRTIECTTFSTVGGALHPLSMRLANRRIGYTLSFVNQKISGGSPGN